MCKTFGKSFNFNSLLNHVEIHSNNFPFTFSFYFDLSLPVNQTSTLLAMDIFD